MTRHVIADNWSLQHISDLLSNGISPSEASVIRVSGHKHEYVNILEGAIQTEALFDLLTDIVLRDEIIVDANYSDTWDTDDRSLSLLSRSGMLRKMPFLNDEDKYSDIRELIVDRLCVTDSLRAAHAANVESWNSEKQASDPYLAAVLWGGAGMAARSWAFESAYCPHPLRRRLFESTNFLGGTGSAIGRLEKVVDEARLQIAKNTSPSDLFCSLRVLLPPIPIRIIEQSSTPSDFLSVAMQLRPEFQTVRDWIGETEMYLDNDQIDAVRKQYEKLDAVSARINKVLGQGSGDATFSINLGILRLSIKGDPISSLKNRFGIRSAVSKMILGPSGQAALSKYCRLFGESKTTMEFQLSEHFGRSSPS